MTINQILRMSLTENKKINISIENLSEIFNDALVTKITRTEITFLIVEYTKNREHIYEYTYKKRLIVGAAYSKASLDININNEDDGGDIFFLL